MQTVALCLFWWIAVNLAIATIWTVYCLWPRRRHALDLALGGFRRALWILRPGPHVVTLGGFTIANNDSGWQTTGRKILKVLRSPQSAVPLLNAQLRIRGKARLSPSVRLVGRIRFGAEGDVEFGNGVALVGSMVPIEFVSHRGACISIGDHTFINYGSSITAYKQVKIGRNCLLGHHVLIVDKNSYCGEQRWATRPAAPVIIEDQAWIGSHAIILPGVRIGRHAAIGAGSVVTRDIPAACLAVGNPARVVRQLDV
jgi:acetyltransferase-like isoleucine patch superfamily enzyme